MTKEVLMFPLKGIVKKSKEEVVLLLVVNFKLD